MSKTGTTKTVYMDNHATTPADPRVVDAMLPFFFERFGNVASAHAYGRDVRNAVATARSQIAALIGANADEIIFTSGATESNNLALKGAAEALKGQGRHVITCVTEHKSVLDTCAYLESQGYAITYLAVDRFGQVSPAAVRSALRLGRAGTVERTSLVSIMGANNEIGTLHPIEEIAAMIKDAGVMLHVDGAQTVGKIPVSVTAWDVDFMSFTAHKMYGPKGIGALYVRSGKLPLAPLMHGGGQERGYRSGTLPVPLVVGFGAACAIIGHELPGEMKRLASLRDALHAGIQARVPACCLNGHPTERLPGNLNLSFRGFDSELLAVGLRDLAVSSTSACAAAKHKPSHVLKAVGLCDEDALAAVRFGLGRFNTEDDVNFAISRVVATVEKFGPKDLKQVPASKPKDAGL